MSSDSTAQDRKRTREIFKWIQHVARDTELPDGAVRLAVVLSGDYLNGKAYRKDGIHVAFPKQETLASELKTTRRAVNRNIGALKARGHLDIIKPKRRGELFRYRLNLAPGDENVSPEADPGDANVSGGETKTSHHGRRKRLTPHRTKTSHSNHQKESNHQTQPSEGNHQTLGEVTPAEPELFGEVILLDQARQHIANNYGAGFDDFWEVYPRKESKGEAEIAFRDAVMSGATPQELIAGARRYAAARAGQDAKYTKGARNWIRGRCWLDQPPPATGTIGVLNALANWSREQ